ncbi:hypothetical protein ACFL0X_00500 [Nanoarchaeota archaeon]
MIKRYLEFYVNGEKNPLMKIYFVKNGVLTLNRIEGDVSTTGCLFNEGGIYSMSV